MTMSTELQEAVENALKDQERRKGKIALGITLFLLSPFILFIIAVFLSAHA